MLSLEEMGMSLNKDSICLLVVLIESLHWKESVAFELFNLDLIINDLIPDSYELIE